jgi:hypothetical protein
MKNDNLPKMLFHYYNKKDGPFQSISRLSITNAYLLHNKLKDDKKRFASKRDKQYLSKRREIEENIRTMLITKGGKPKITKPHYFVLGECKWLIEWYPEGESICIPIELINEKEISFTYGDSFPTFIHEDGKPYRKQVFLLSELPIIIETYGLPQIVNPTGENGPDRYIEAQLWADYPIESYLNK